MVYGNLKSENSQDYAQKPQRNCTFMNSSSGKTTAEKIPVLMEFSRVPHAHTQTDTLLYIHFATVFTRPVMDKLHFLTKTFFWGNLFHRQDDCAMRNVLYEAFFGTFLRDKLSSLRFDPDSLSESRFLRGKTFRKPHLDLSHSMMGELWRKQ